MAGLCAMAETYVVIVKNNLVTAIERLSEPLDRPIPKTPLEVSTELADNNHRNGCIDGRYYFEDTQRARIFASLCLEFIKALVEKRLAMIEALPVGSAVFRADDERDPDRAAPGAR